MDVSKVGKPFTPSSSTLHYILFRPIHRHRHRHSHAIPSTVSSIKYAYPPLALSFLSRPLARPRFFILHSSFFIHYSFG